MSKPLLLAAFAALTLLCGPVSAQSISEETPPISCGHLLVRGVTCTGRYCDNMKPICGAQRHEIYNIRWSKFVSEEGDATANCNVSNPYERGDYPAGEPAFIAGFACNGDYCDNVALECVALKDAFPASLGGNQCRWTAWASEETPTVDFGAGYGAIRMQCGGRYCDNIRFLVCPVKQR